MIGCMTGIPVIGVQLPLPKYSTDSSVERSSKQGSVGVGNDNNLLLLVAPAG